MAERELQQRRERDVEARRRASGREAAPATMGGPFAFMRRFAEEMDRLFEDFGGGGPRIELWSRGGQAWTPQIEVFDRDGSFVVRADLPGMTRDQIEVEIRDDLLYIQGERREERREEREGFFHTERSYGTFRRAVPLPEGVEPEKVQATFRDGVLEVTMPMTRQASRSRRIEIGGESQAAGMSGGVRGADVQGAGVGGAGPTAGTTLGETGTAERGGRR